MPAKKRQTLPGSLETVTVLSSLGFQCISLRSTSHSVVVSGMGGGTFIKVVGHK